MTEKFIDDIFHLVQSQGDDYRAAQRVEFDNFWWLCGSYIDKVRCMKHLWLSDEFVILEFGVFYTALYILVLWPGFIKESSLILSDKFVIRLCEEVWGSRFWKRWEDRHRKVLPCWRTWQFHTWSNYLLFSNIYLNFGQYVHLVSVQNNFLTKSSISVSQNKEVP